MELNPLFAHHPPYLKIVILLIVIFASLLFVSLLGMLVAVPLFGIDVLENVGNISDYSDPANLIQLKYFQLVSQIGLFVVPVLLFVFLMAKKKAEYLYLSGKQPVAQLLAAAAVILLALPFINWLLDVNMMLELPASWSGIEKWMKGSEEEAARVTEAFLITQNVGDFILNLLMIAIIPAIGEELLFRGIIMRLFKEWTKNIHVAILISAALFSFIHFQFYGFLPRFMMGVMFGYMLYWSGSIWVPVLAHFVNNAAAVVVAYLAANKFSDLDFNTFGSSNNPLIVIASALVVSLVLVFFWLKRKKTLTETAEIIIENTN